MIIDLPSIYSEWHPVAPIDLSTAAPVAAPTTALSWDERLEQAGQALAAAEQDERRAFAAEYCRRYGI